jgi:DNA gyrase subunit B
VIGKKAPQTFIVADSGRGIPVGKHKKTGISTLTSILTTVHAGGKFDDKAYGGRSRGLHGLGVSATVALSSSFEVWTYRDSWHYQKFTEGKPIDKVRKKKLPKELSAVTPNRRKGTIIKYTPDYSILGKGAHLSNKVLLSWLEDMANLNAGLQIVVETDAGKETYINKGGPKSYLSNIVEHKKAETIGKPFIFQHKDMTVALQWSDYEKEDGIVSYINGAETEHGGTHVKGLTDAIVRACQKCAPKKSKKKWGPPDIMQGVVGFINLFFKNPEYDSQTKSRLVSSGANKKVSDSVIDALFSFLKKNKKMTRIILNRATNIKQAREQARQITKAAAEIKKKGKSALLPGKFLAASSKTPPGEIELFLVEGDSAKGTAKDARDSSFQAVLPLRGKIINAAKSSTSAVLESKEVQAILAAIGANGDDGAEFRIGKIMLLMDADEDGRHISNLVCTLLHTMIPKVFDRGMVYSINAPLYLAQTNKGTKYAYTLKGIKKKIKGDKQANITRMKGWGEASWQTLQHIAFSEKTRKVSKILAVKGKDKIQFYKIVGEDVTTRKKLLGLI